MENREKPVTLNLGEAVGIGLIEHGSNVILFGAAIGLAGLLWRAVVGEPKPSEKPAA